MALTLFWFRRDLRLHDNVGLYYALKGEHPVLPLFIFDQHILEDLPVNDARVEFIWNTIQNIQQQLEKLGSSLLVKVGEPEKIWPQLLKDYDIQAVYTNRDYEPYATQRDEAVRKLVEQKGIPFHTYKDHVIFERGEILKKDGTPYTVFTPYQKQWLHKFYNTAKASPVAASPQSYLTEKYFTNFFQLPPLPIPSLADLGFKPTDIPIPPNTLPQSVVENYDNTKDYPALEGTSRLDIHLRFGTMSIRETVQQADNLNATFLNELIWRDFFVMILAHFPNVVEASFRPQYDRIEWRNSEADFQKWCAGKTGYPLVDAGMRQLNATGFMHNRVRMVAASFLTKHLLIDWRWGEAYFAEKLLDYELANNNGNWQWAAGSGTDAAPYFRIFNPATQLKKFDKELTYVKKWIPEYGTDAYPEPMVEHTLARERCLRAYRKALAKG